MSVQKAEKDAGSAWYRLPVTIVCEQRPGISQWLPFFIRGILRTACKDPLTFHHRDGGVLPDAAEVGASYPLDLFITRSGDIGEVVARLKGLRFDDFRILVDGSPEKRHPGQLMEERGGKFAGVREVGLEFVSPLVTEGPVDQGIPLLDTKKFLRILEARIDATVGHGFWPVELPEVEVASWFMNRGARHTRLSKSQPGHRETLGGQVGPLYVRGDIEALLGPLLIAEELHVGRSLAVGAGHFTLRLDLQALDPLLEKEEVWLGEAQRLREDPERREDWLHPLAPDDREVCKICAGISSGEFPSEPATKISIPKPGGGDRVVGNLPHRTFLFHRVLAKILGPAVNRRLSPAALAYRPGRSVKMARPFLTHAIEAGCTHVAKADIAKFFDEIPWEKLRECVEQFVPLADRQTRRAVESAWSLPWTGGERKAGVMQGSPLSPLLANLFLAGWDDAMAARGFLHVRYGDDLLLTAASEEEVRLALVVAEALLAPLGLRLQPEKTLVCGIADGFRHLGLDMGGEDGDITETSKPSLRRTLYLTRPEEWAGLDHGAILLRDAGKLIHRLPLLQIGHIVALGIGGFSTALMTACMHRGIVVTFADHTGHHCGTLHAEPRQFYRAVEAHARARQALSPAALADLARDVVRAKLEGYESWAEHLIPPASSMLTDAARTGVESLTSKTDLSSFLGVEGSSARKIFRSVNDLCKNPFWKSEHRLPHARRDPWNLLVDTLSFLLFTRINASLRGASLDPFLGFLHSPEDRFESLVCDLQEPFRARCDRLAVRLANLNLLRPEHADRLPDGTWTWAPGAWHAIISEFECELDRRRGADQLDWRTQIHHLVEAVRLWAPDPARGLSLRPPGAGHPKTPHHDRR